EERLFKVWKGLDESQVVVQSLDNPGLLKHERSF
ncbi:unnamed protein product, partial [marine sediment metagenome]